MKKQKLREAKSGEGKAGDGEENASATQPEANKSAGDLILEVEPKISVDFTIPKGLDMKKKAQRFPMNPEKNWGPKPRATNKRKALPPADAPATKEAKSGED